MHVNANKTNNGKMNSMKIQHIAKIYMYLSARTDRPLFKCMHGNVLACCVLQTPSKDVYIEQIQSGQICVEYKRKVEMK